MDQSYIKRIHEIKPTNDAVDKAFDIAIKIMGKKKYILVSGPITTGGYGNVSDNTAVMNIAIKTLQAKGHDVFDQMYFGPLFAKIEKLHAGISYKGQIFIDRFYEKLMQKGKINKLVQLPNWESSNGAQQEYTLAKKYNIEITSFDSITKSNTENY